MMRKKSKGASRKDVAALVAAAASGDARRLQAALTDHPFSHHHFSPADLGAALLAATGVEELLAWQAASDEVAHGDLDALAAFSRARAAAARAVPERAAAVTRLLAAGADAGAAHACGATPLFCAAACGHAASVGALLAHRRLARAAPPGGAAAGGAAASLEAGPPGETPLAAAAAAGDLPCVEALLAAGADPNPALRSGSLLGNACLPHVPLAVVRALIGGGAEVEGAGADGITPLMAAAGAGHAGAVRLLLYKHGAATEGTAADGRRTSALACAIAGDRADVCQMLLEAGADAAAPLGPGGPTAAELADALEASACAAALARTTASPGARPPRPALPRLRLGSPGGEASPLEAGSPFASATEGDEGRGMVRVASAFFSKLSQLPGMSRLASALSLPHGDAPPTAPGSAFASRAPSARGLDFDVEGGVSPAPAGPGPSPLGGASRLFVPSFPVSEGAPDTARSLGGYDDAEAPAPAAAAATPPPAGKRALAPAAAAGAGPATPDDAGEPARAAPSPASVFSSPGEADGRFAVSPARPAAPAGASLVLA